MSDKTWLGRRWKLILNIVTLAALALLIYAIRHQLGATFRDLAHVNGWALLLIIPVEALNYHAQAKLYQGLFRLVGNNLSYGFLYRAALELNFVNHVFPSGGVTGLSYFSVRMRKGQELTGSKATLVQVVKLGLTFLSFELLIIFGLFCLAIMGRVSNLTILVAAVVSTLLVVGTIGFAYIVGSKRRIDNFFTGLTKGLNRLIQLVRRDNPETINIGRVRQVFNDFHNNYDVINIGAVIFAYAVANFAGLVSVLPGGVGIYEALMTAVLASTGVAAAVSLPVTVMYRVVNTLIQLPPGYYLYQQTLRRGQVPPGAPGVAPETGA
jgi:putative heme transporter